MLKLGPDLLPSLSDRRGRHRAVLRDVVVTDTQQPEIQDLAIDSVVKHLEHVPDLDFSACVADSFRFSTTMGRTSRIPAQKNVT